MLRHIAIFTLSVWLSGCAAPSGLCGERPAIEVRPRPEITSDPYTGWQHFGRNTKRYADAVNAGDADGVRGAAWNVCRDAVALKVFTKEVPYERRPQFAEILTAVITNASAIASKRQDPISPAANQNLLETIGQLERNKPKFWLSPGAKLRGSNQPGSPLHPHE